MNHYYIYLIDPEWGPAFIKICGYAPYAIKICLNGHEWAKRQLHRARLRFTALDNGFLSCPNPTHLQACDALAPTDIDDFFRRWEAVFPLPLTAAHRAAGFTYQLSILQLEVSRTQVFDRPLRGREFFETVIRDNLDLGRPDHVQLLFPRQIRRNTPGRFMTHVITTGVNPSLHIAYKRCRIKQYFKEERALRTETTFNDTSDFGIGRRLSNLSYLRTLGDHINHRVRETESLAHDCGLAPAQLADLVQPTQTPTGQPAPALKFGQPRVTAVLNALCHFLWTADGLTNAQLRPLGASLLGTAYTTRQMGYDLRRLTRKGLIKRLDGPTTSAHNICRARSRDRRRRRVQARVEKRARMMRLDAITLDFARQVIEEETGAPLEIQPRAADTTRGPGAPQARPAGAERGEGVPASDGDVASGGAKPPVWKTRPG